MLVDPLLLTTTPIFTYLADTPMTNASGFFYRNGGDLFLVTSRHVFYDEKTEHFPDRIEIKIHVDPDNATRTVYYSIPLYIDRNPQWIAGSDSSGDVDVAVIKIVQKALPEEAVYTAFTPENLLGPSDTIEIGTSMLIIGFPLGFHDTFHHLPVARQAINASSFAMRFQGNGYFLTDARTHRGSSGAAVVSRMTGTNQSGLPWLLLGVHSARLDMLDRDLDVDEALGLNCAWFADILLTLTVNESVTNNSV